MIFYTVCPHAKMGQLPKCPSRFDNALALCFLFVQTNMLQTRTNWRRAIELRGLWLQPTAATSIIYGQCSEVMIRLNPMPDEWYNGAILPHDFCRPTISSIFITHQRHEMSESADENATNLLNLLFLIYQKSNFRRSSMINKPNYLYLLLRCQQ